MRNLTQQEIDDAPEWATSYFIYSDGQEIRWQDNVSNIFMWSHEGVRFPFPRVGYNRGKSINRKPFDISEYEFSDADIMVITKASRSIEIRSNNTAGVHLSHYDAIALAKHFKLTAEDLK